MSVRTMPAAAIPEGAEVLFPGEDGEPPVNITIVFIENSTPQPGLITWWDESDRSYVVRASIDVIVVSLPDFAIEQWNKIGARK